MSDVSNKLTRKDLSSISTILRVIRALEKLFNTVVDTTADINNTAETAVNKSNMVLGMAVNNQERSEGNEVLQWLTIQ